MVQWIRRSARLCAAALVLSAPSPGIELQLYFSALQRLLAATAFTQDGRMYVRGDGKNKCNFAYLENPVISSAGTKLVIRARFSGRSAGNFFGACVGLGDSFDLVIAALPYYRNGAVALKEVQVDHPGRDGFYIRRVCAAIADTLNRQFAYNVAADSKRVLEQKRDPLYSQELSQFNVTGIRITPDSIIVGLDFRLAVK